METLISILIALVRTALLVRASLALETAALRQQLTIYQRNQKRPRFRTAARAFWILLRRLWSGWDRALIVVKPETVIVWHRRGFKLLWRLRSHRRVGRPRIPCEYIAFIRCISGDHPEWDEDRIAEEFDGKFGIHRSASTIRRYKVRRTDGPRKVQTWRAFIQNHAKEVWARDFLTQHTASSPLSTSSWSWRSVRGGSSMSTSLPTRRSPGSSSGSAKRRPRAGFLASSLSGAEGATARDGAARRAPSPRWRSARLPSRGVGLRSSASLIDTVAGATTPSSRPHDVPHQRTDPRRGETPSPAARRHRAPGCSWTEITAHGILADPGGEECPRAFNCLVGCQLRFLWSYLTITIRPVLVPSAVDTRIR